jgi:IS30 family transposase
MSERVGHRWPQRVKDEFWKLRKEGTSVLDAALLVGKSPTLLHRFAKRHGGIAPPKRQRSVRALSEAEREEISRGVTLNLGVREIARRLRRSASTVSRELTRNGGRDRYRAVVAEARYMDELQRPKPCRLSQNPRLCKIIACKLLRKWSPQQIAAWLKLRYVNKPEMWVSHETIYRTLFVQARGVLKKELMAHLRLAKGFRHAKKAADTSPIQNAVSIRERPAEVEDRAIPGHWEGDLIEGSNNSYIITLVERQTRFVMLSRVTGKDTESVTGALRRKIRKLPTELRRTLTWDRGSEMAAHAKLSVDAQIDIYFCDPYSPWQRGTNENTNGLLRQYFPKGSDLSVHTQAHLNRVAMELNTRPRKTLGYTTPAFKLQQVLQ